MRRTMFNAALGVAAMLAASCDRPVPLAVPAAGRPTLTDTAQSDRASTDAPPDESSEELSAMTSEMEYATFGAGCFWCVEAVLEQLDGVVDVESGYMGGFVENPTYDQVCSGLTGHAEVVRVTFEPAKIAYATLLGWFWKLHDPTTLNRQGGDVGTQYRSVIFAHSDAQRAAAEASKKEADAAGEFSAPIVTEIAAAATFYPAEKYHQDYYRQNRSQPYCRAVITPKLDKLGLEE